MICLTAEQITRLHDDVLKETGGDGGLRDQKLLESALYAPFQCFENVEPYPSLLQKAARLCFGLVMNHPFLDGNKRIGAHAMLVFLALNGVELTFTQHEFSEIIWKIASSEKSYDELLEWVISHQK